MLTPPLARIAVFLIAVAAAAGVGNAESPAPLAPAAPYRAPYVPASDGERLQEVPSTRDPAVAQMRELRAAFDAAPHEFAAALPLANAYIDYSRQIGDAHFAGYAEAVIAPWTSLATPPANALLTEATILQYRHQFPESRELLRRTLGMDPRNAQAWITLATLDMVQGDYPRATTDCAQVANTAGVDIGTACLGNLRSYTGQAQQSLVLLRQAEATASRGAAGYRAWIEGLIAETAERLGDWPLAEAHYQAALKLLPRDNFLLVAYADFLLDRGRAQEVLPLLADHAQSDTAFLRIALAQAALHSPEAARFTWIMAARFEALTLRGSDYFGREEARFALQLQHDPQTSLDMARKNWRVQRAPWDARVLLEAAAAARQPGAAVEVLAFLKSTNLQDPIVVPLAQRLSRELDRTAGAQQ
jgi:tetratricopeptide (TPR) repeat protein